MRDEPDLAGKPDIVNDHSNASLKLSSPIEPPAKVGNFSLVKPPLTIGLNPGTGASSLENTLPEQQRIPKVLGPTLKKFYSDSDKFAEEERFTDDDIEEISKSVYIVQLEQIKNALIASRTELEKIGKSFLYKVLTLGAGTNKCEQLTSSAIYGLATFGPELVNKYHYNEDKIIKTMMGKAWLKGAHDALKKAWYLEHSRIGATPSPGGKDQEDIRSKVVISEDFLLPNEIECTAERSKRPADWSLGPEEKRARSNALQTLNTYKILGKTLKSFSFAPNQETFTPEELAGIAEAIPPYYAANIDLELAEKKDSLEQIGKSVLYWVLTLDNGEKQLHTLVAAIRSLAKEGRQLVIDYHRTLPEIQAAVQSKRLSILFLPGVADALQEMLRIAQKNKSLQRRQKPLSSASLSTSHKNGASSASAFFNAAPHSLDAPEKKSGKKLVTLAEIILQKKHFNSPEVQTEIYDLLGPTLRGFYQDTDIKKFAEEDRFTEDEIKNISKVVPLKYLKRINNALTESQLELEKIDKSFLISLLTLSTSNSNNKFLSSAIRALATYGPELIRVHQYDEAKILKTMLSNSFGRQYFCNASEAMSEALNQANLLRQRSSSSSPPPLPSTFFSNSSVPHELIGNASIPEDLLSMD